MYVIMMDDEQRGYMRALRACPQHFTAKGEQ